MTRTPPSLPPSSFRLVLCNPGQITVASRQLALACTRVFVFRVRNRFSSLAKAAAPRRAVPARPERSPPSGGTSTFRTVHPMLPGPLALAPGGRGPRALDYCGASPGCKTGLLAQACGPRRGAGARPTNRPAQRPQRTCAAHLAALNLHPSRDLTHGHGESLHPARRLVGRRVLLDPPCLPDWRTTDKNPQAMLSAGWADRLKPMLASADASSCTRESEAACGAPRMESSSIQPAQPMWTRIEGQVVLPLKGRLEPIPAGAVPASFFRRAENPGCEGTLGWTRALQRAGLLFRPAAQTRDSVAVHGLARGNGGHGGLPRDPPAFLRSFGLSPACPSRRSGGVRGFPPLPARPAWRTCRPPCAGGHGFGKGRTGPHPLGAAPGFA